MRWRPRVTWVSAVLAPAAIAIPASLGAQGVRELELRALAIASQPAFGGLGVGAGWRPSPRTRILVGAASGVLEGGAWAARAEAAAHFLLDPARARGGVYGGGGLSLEGTARRVRPFVMLVIGVDRAPGGRRGVYAELGVGGGVRLAAGFRWRWRAPGG